MGSCPVPLQILIENILTYYIDMWKSFQRNLLYHILFWGRVFIIGFRHTTHRTLQDYQTDEAQLQ